MTKTAKSNKKSKRSKRKAKVVRKKALLVDATKPLTIHVTRSDVTHAKKMDPGGCAAALALSRELKTDVKVHITKTYVRDGDHWVRYNTPESMAREIVSFDRSSQFEPGDYELVPVPPSMRLGRKQGGSQTHPNTGAKRPIHHITAAIRHRAPKVFD